jgi:7-keto-8-aminopelargonate synthetase-like enzyme
MCTEYSKKKEPERVSNLNDIADYMRGLLKERNIPLNETSTPIIPIMTYEDIRTFILCKELLNEGVYVNPVISPAVPQGFSMIRTSYTATHTRELMDEAADIIAKVFARI